MMMSISNHCNHCCSGVQTAIRIVLLVSIPVVFLIGITTNVLRVAVQESDFINMANKAVTEAIELSSFVSRVQIERGTTAMFLSSNRSSLQAYAGLASARVNMQSQLAALPSLPSIQIGNMTLSNKEELLRYIDKHRKRVDHSNPIMLLKTNLQFYTEIDLAISDYISKRIVVPHNDRWLVAFNALFLARDIAGIERAIGSTYFMQCHFTPDLKHWFSQLKVEFKIYLQLTFQYHPKSKERDMKMLAKKLQEDIALFYERFQDDAYNVVCREESIDERQILSQSWFDNMTLYISHLAYIMNELANDLHKNLSEAHAWAKTEVVIYSSTLAVVLFCSGFTMYLIYMMTMQMQSIASSLNGKTKELEGEKKRTEDLLNQMLPATVADRLKRNQAVPAEFYDMVTIYFSDVVGFTSISAKLSPHQVIELLNSLYILFDGVIDKYDAYKVETIGDAYMVASGLPERNGDEHARQIALMALDIQDLSTTFLIPHTTEFIRIRIGLHSGPCASGIVGKKMPRFCLFGDTVNTASRMESTGEPRRIQISHKTKEMLDVFGGFQCQERGSIAVKGKGKMTTYWLIGRAIVPNSTLIEPRTVHRARSTPTTRTTSTGSRLKVCSDVT